MKKSLFSNFNKDKMYGTTTVGARGQVVIPAKARKDLKIEPGDQLLVVGKMEKVLGLVKVEQLQELIEAIMKHAAGTGREKEVKEHLNKFFGKTI